MAAADFVAGRLLEDLGLHKLFVDLKPTFLYGYKQEPSYQEDTIRVAELRRQYKEGGIKGTGRNGYS